MMPLIVKNYFDKEMQCFEKFELVFWPYKRLFLFLYIQPMLDGKLLSNLDLISCNLRKKMSCHVFCVSGS